MPEDLAERAERPAAGGADGAAARRRGRFTEARGHLDAYERNRGPRPPLELELRLLRLQKGDLTEVNLLGSFCEDHPEEAEVPLILEALVEGVLGVLDPGHQLGRTYDLEKGEAVPFLKAALRAVDRWDKLATGSADRAQGLAWRGRLHLLLGEVAKAEKDLRAALELDPDHFDARMALVRAIAQQSPREAVEHFETLRRLQPKNNHVRFGLATAWRGLGKFDEAGEILDEMLADDPDDTSALLERGRLDLDLGRPGDAERRLRKAHRLAPHVPEINHVLGSCLQTIPGKQEEGRSFIDRAQKLEAEYRKGKDVPPKRKAGEK